MSNNRHEGWDGYRISQIAEKAKASQRNLDPNIILLYAGINDLNENNPVDSDQAPDRLGTLVDQINADSPDAVVLVAQIIKVAVTKSEALIKAYNEAIPGVVKRRADKGHKVLIADMRGISDLSYSLYPNDLGYQKMADVWFKGIQEASKRGWIKAPKTSDPKYLLPAPGSSKGPQSRGSGGLSSSSGRTTGSGQGMSSSKPSNTGSTSGAPASTQGTGTQGSRNSGNSKTPGNGGNGRTGGTRSGSPGSESTTSASDNGANGASLTGAYLGGGKEIPAAGLAGLGLAVIGIPAITCLTPYVVTAQNDLLSANHALTSLTVGAATSGGVLAAAGAVDIAAKDIGALFQQAKAWKLDTLPTGLKGEAQKEQKALQDTARSLSDIVPRLQGCAATPKRSNACPVFFKLARDKVGGKSAVAPLTWFTLGNEPDLPPFFPHASGSSNAGAGGSGNGGSGGSGSSVLGGGLPILKGGLRSLGLPIRGAGAINGLKPYAITTQNAISKALGLLNGLLGGTGTAAADVSAAAESLADAASGFTELSTAFGDVELSSVPGGRVFEVQQTKLAFLSIVKKFGNALSPLRGCISHPGACQNVYRGTAGIIGAVSIGAPLVAIINYEDTGMLQPTPMIPANSTTTSKSVPTAWILNTVPGTPVKDFQAFIQTLPDRGSGKRIIFEGSDYQNYVTKMTRAQALIVSKAPIVDMMTRNDPVRIARHFISNETLRLLSHKLKSRVNEPVVIREGHQQRYQQMISTRKTDPVALIYPNVNLGYLYHYERSAGRGSFVYVFDGGFDFLHPEFNGQTPEAYVVPGLSDETGAAVPDTRDDMNGHGTACAAAVGGSTLGIAKSVKIIGVKFTSTDDPKPEDIVLAWRCAIRDARVKGRLGKTVFSHSYGWPMPLSDLPNQQHVPAYYRPPYNIPPPRFAEWWPPLLAEAWRKDIVTVFSTGNIPVPADPRVTNQGSQSPTRFCKSNNPIISVASVDAGGQPSPFNLPLGPNPAYNNFDQDLVGEETVFAHGQLINVAKPASVNSPSMYEIKLGTSYAAPQIAGLAAYYLSLPNSVAPPERQVAMAVKRQLVELSRDNSMDAPKLAYNGVWEAPCGALTKREKADIQAMEAALALAKLKGLHLA
ncbi:MAG: hypothetical protein Q9209_005057 [Squamulea sp. 1 TL-2023]